MRHADCANSAGIVAGAACIPLALEPTEHHNSFRAPPRLSGSACTIWLVLFPALHKIEEDRLFGEEGFEKTVDQVAAIERELGIHDLALFAAK